MDSDSLNANITRCLRRAVLTEQMVSSFIESVSDPVANRKAVSDHPEKLGTHDNCQFAVGDNQIHFVVSDHDGRTLIDSSKYIQRLFVDVYDDHGSLIFSSREHFSKRRKRLLVAKKNAKEQIKQNKTEQNKKVKQACAVHANSADRINELPLRKSNITKTEKGNITNSEKNSITSIQKGNITYSGKNNITNLEKGNITYSEKGNITDSEKSNITSIQKGNITYSGKNNITNLEKGNITSIQKGNITDSEKNNITDSKKGNITNSEKNNITNLQKGNITHSEKSNINCEKSNVTNKTVVQLHHRTIEKSEDLKDEVQDFVSDNELEVLDTSIDYEGEADVDDLTSNSANTEVSGGSQDHVRFVRSKITSAKQGFLSKTNVKESAGPEDPFKCDVCGVLYKSDIMLNKRKQVHEMECTDSKHPLQCAICKKVYQNWKSLTIHKRKHGAAKDQVCEKCGKGFRTRQELVRHEFVHTNAKSSPCHICGKLFKNKAYAQMHSKLHLAENRKHVCILCKKNFLRGPDIQKHMRIHTGEKPFICSHCGRSFCESSHLIRHERLHTGEKPYKCDECDHTFTHKEVLLRHAFSHVKYLPFSCEVCSKGFKTKRELNHHSLIHEKPTGPTRKETCKVCGQVFSHGLHLRYHLCTRSLNTFERPISAEVFNGPSHL